MDGRTDGWREDGQVARWVGRWAGEWMMDEGLGGWMMGGWEDGVRMMEDDGRWRVGE